MLFTVVLAAGWVGYGHAQGPAPRPIPANIVDAIRFTIAEIRIEGNTLVSAEDLREAVAPFLGSGKRLENLNGARRTIVQAYQERGYELLSVDYDRTRSKAGVHYFLVHEVRLGKIRVTGNRAIAEGEVRRQFPGLREGGTPRLSQVARELFLFNDNPGRNAGLEYTPGGPGVTDVEIKVAEQPQLRTAATYNNTGTSVTGTSRLGLYAAHANFLGRSHQVAGSLTTSDRPDRVMQAGFGYVLPLPEWGDSVAFSASYSDVDSGRVADLFNISGKGSTAGVHYQRSLARTLTSRHVLDVGYDERHFRDVVDFFGTNLGVSVTDKPVSLGYRYNGAFKGGAVAFGATVQQNIPGGSHNDDATYAAARAPTSNCRDHASARPRGCSDSLTSVARHASTLRRERGRGSVFQASVRVGAGSSGTGCRYRRISRTCSTARRAIRRVTGCCTFPRSGGFDREVEMNAMKRTVMATVVAGVFGSAWGNPTTPTVVSGAALLSNPSASVMQVVNTPGTIINWQGFSIANGETTRFVQLNAASAVLNRAVGGNPSAILGRLESNGRVFLNNPNGIVFGGGSVVDVAGLIASTRDITDANFLAGNYLFNGFSNGVITVQNGAQILTSNYGPGGQVWLFAKNVTIEAGATITTPQGQTVLAAGTELQVATNSLGQMSFAVATDGTNTVDSLGTIAADRGAVGMFADFVNHRGTVNAGVGGSVDMNAAAELRIQGASTINAPDGNITLRGGSLLEVEFDSVINADGASGRISFESNNLLVYPSGNVHAVGGDVTFVQYQPSQYLPATVQFPWATPNGFSDSNPIAFRRSDGNYVVRFQRTMSSGDAAGLFEAVLDGRTGALLSAPVAIAAGSAQAAAYNAARVAPAVATNTYNTKIAEANAALRTALDLATTTEQDGFDRAANTAAGAIDGLAPTVEALIATRKSQVDALRADATDHPGSHPNLDFEVSNIVGFYRGQTYDAVRLAVYESRLASAGVRPGMESAVPTVDTFNSTLADLLAAKFASRDSADATASAAITAANAAYSAASQAATTQLPVATAAYNASLVAGIPVFYSNADTSLRGVPLATRLPTGNGGAVVALRQPDRVISGDGEDGPYTYTELGGRGAGFEVRSATGALIASDPNLNALPMPDGTYLAHQTGGYDVYKLDGTYVRSEARGYGILIPNRLGGFSELQVEGPAQQVNYTKVVPAYTSLNYVPGVAGAATRFATRPGAANDDGSNPTSPRTNPTVPVIRGGPGGGAIVDDSSDICNSALCTGIAGVHRRWDEAQQAIEAGRIPPKDVGNMTEREFIDSLIAADNLGEGGKIDDQSAAVAVMALARAAGRGSAVSIDGALSTGFAMQDNGELRQLVLGYGDLGNMSPAERFNVLERWLGELKATQTLGAMGQERTNATISIRDIVSNMTTREEMTDFMNTIAEQTRNDWQ